MGSMQAGSAVALGGVRRSALGVQQQQQYSIYRRSISSIHAAVDAMMLHDPLLLQMLYASALLLLAPVLLHGYHSDETTAPQTT